MTGQSSSRRIGVLFLALGVGACAGGDNGEETAMEGGEAAAPAEQEVRLELPDTSATNVWQYLQAENYQDAWQTWPEKDPFYAGGEPHGALLTTYANQAALEAIGGETGVLPPGAIVVKENYMPDSTLAAVTVMYKVEGYNPENNDWWFAKFMPDGSLDTMPDGMEMEGRVPGCTNCHGGARANDFIFTSPLAGVGSGG